MNDPNKAINVNLSSLLSLKAELLRKQAEVSKAKATRISAANFIPNKFPSNKKRENESDEKSSEAPPSNELEDSELLQKSQKTLEAKSKYYERMQRTGGKLNSDDNCLVLFNRKRQEEDPVPPESYDAQHSSEDSSSGSESEDDDDWVEYVDCLGRTRKCLRKDLESVKKRDKELAASMPERLDQSKPNWMLDMQNPSDEVESLIGPDPPESVFSEGISMISKHDEMRVNWEKKHEENLDKPDVHYQDVFFDEARQHGVGYYAFSTDESERAKQQRELEEARKQTLTEQEHRDKLRAQREKIIAERVRGAKNRQRARLGLPPLEENEKDEKDAETEAKVETKEERKERKRLNKLKRKQEKLEAKLELERKHHIRPWDREKDGVKKTTHSKEAEEEEEEWNYQPERLPMSQEEWNEHKRSERNPHFAPPSSTTNLRTNFTSSTYIPDIPTDFATFQSTKAPKQFQRRSYQSDVNTTEEKSSPAFSRGAAIPPPADLDSSTYLPPNAKKSKASIELERSIEAGLRFLRNNSDKNTTSMKSSWTAKADY